jgi:vitamin K-dependent gamma-carboxylase
MIERILRAADAQVDNAWLIAFRMLFGGAMFISMVRFIAYGWVESLFIRPRFHFTYWGFEWIHPLPPGPMTGLFYALAVFALCVMFGFFYRFAIWSLLLGFVYIQLIDVTTYLNHYYLATWLLLLLALAPSTANGTCGRGWQWLFRFQIGVIYTFAGLAKAESDWLVHAQPLGIWLSARTDIPLLGVLFRSSYAPWLMSWGGFLFDTAVPWLLLWSRTRIWAYAAVLCFHTTVGLLFPIGMFPVWMMIGALSFFPPSWPRFWLRSRAAVKPAQPQELKASPWKGVAFGCYAMAHLLMPLRHHLYGGNVLWDEQGMRWSWKVMVREKNATLTYRVRDPINGHEMQVAPRRYLSRWQEREMSGQPDLILQLAHHIRDEYTTRLHRVVEVRVESAVSLNGRAPAPLIDPHVDLSIVHDGISLARWVLPAPREAPPLLNPI